MPNIILFNMGNMFTIKKKKKRQSMEKTEDRSRHNNNMANSSFM